MLKKSLMFVVVVMFMAAGCGKGGSEESPSVGTAKMAVTMGEYEVTEVDWTITDSEQAVVREGSIKVKDPMAKISTEIGGIPAGEGYVLALAAIIKEGDEEVGTCAQSANFDIIAGETTMIEITLNCILKDENGGLNVKAEGNICPVIGYVTASPLVQVYGENITIEAEANDANGDEIAVAWSAEKGEFNPQDQLNTVYTCTSNGTIELDLNVTDNVSMADDNTQCDTQKSITVECISKAVCGNNIKEEGEECEDGNTAPNDGCDEACNIEYCGDEKTQDGIGEECDPPNGVSCNDECKIIGCGNGTIELEEECDDNNRENCDGCNELCKLEVCGNGVVDCNEECDDGNDIPNDGCENNCRVTIDKCDECASGNCDDYGGDDVYAACYEGDTSEACAALMKCAHKTKCPTRDANGDAWSAPHPNKCYCGTASTMACMTGGANGACIAEVEAAADSTDPMVIGERFANPAYAVGDAMGLLLCEMDFCVGEDLCL